MKKTCFYLLLALMPFVILFQRCTEDESPELAGITTIEVVDITNTTANILAEVGDDGGSKVTSRGVCWSTDPNPIVTNFTTNNGTGEGLFTAELTGLQPGMTYFVRAYAKNEVGTSYGNEVSFITLAQLPQVSTTPVSNISSSSAQSGGTILQDGGATITARGLCWSTSINPTTANFVSNNGTGLGTFESTLSNLAAGTTYYARAFATNSAGTAYGNQISFSTESIVTTIYVSKDASIANNAAGNSVSANYGSGASQQLLVAFLSSALYARTLVQFDLSSIPTTAIIENVSLQFSEAGKGNNPPVVSVFRNTAQNWTEGTTSNNCPSTGACNTAVVLISTGGTDVTWNEFSFSGALSRLWNTAGGNLSSTASATAPVIVTGTPNQIHFNTAGIIADVQNWVSTPSSNFGWILKMDESTTPTSAAYRYISKEGAVGLADPTKAPRLVITYR